MTTLEADAASQKAKRTARHVAVDCWAVTNRMWDWGSISTRPTQQAASVAETIRRRRNPRCRDRILDRRCGSSPTGRLGHDPRPVGRLFADTLGRVNQLMALGQTRSSSYAVRYR